MLQPLINLQLAPVHLTLITPHFLSLMFSAAPSSSSSSAFVRNHPNTVPPTPRLKFRKLDRTRNFLGFIKASCGCLSPNGASGGNRHKVLPFGLDDEMKKPFRLN